MKLKSILSGVCIGVLTLGAGIGTAFAIACPCLQSYNDSFPNYVSSTMPGSTLTFSKTSGPTNCNTLVQGGTLPTASCKMTFSGSSTDTTSASKTNKATILISWKNGTGGLLPTSSCTISAGAGSRITKNTTDNATEAYNACVRSINETGSQFTIPVQ